MYEKFLENDENAELHETCAYSGNNAIALHEGYAVLTNKRFFILKKNISITGALLESGITVGLFAIIYIGTLIVAGVRLGMVPTILLGMICYAIAKTVAKKYNAKEQTQPTDATVVTIKREDIETIEHGKHGIAKMLVLKSKNETICKFATKNNDKWESALKR